MSDEAVSFRIVAYVCEHCGRDAVENEEGEYVCPVCTEDDPDMPRPA